MSDNWDLIVFDEINYAVKFGLLDVARVTEKLFARRRSGCMLF